jgi:MFS family permease
MTIFLPVWVDAFAPKEKRTRWMTLCLCASPMGLLTGYFVSAIVVAYTDSWWWAFYILILSMMPLVIIMSLIDGSYIAIKEHLRLKQ